MYFDRLMEETDPDLVYLLFDTGHLAFSGEDALRVLRKYAKRIKHVHLKSVRNDVVAKAKAEGYSFLDAVRAGVFTVPATGISTSGRCSISSRTMAMRAGSLWRRSRTRRRQTRMNMP